jgi:hypothetical protein
MAVSEAKKSMEIGMRRGWLLAQMPAARQLEVIADGLPILLKSADDLFLASAALTDHPRAASILEGHAIEEVSKILILMDIVRCPEKLRPGLTGTMFKWFYDHLARLIYADAQTWRPVNMEQLQEYVDSHRRSHSLEGYAGEYIVPNWTTFSRESELYADIVAYEDGEPTWNEPLGSAPLFGAGRPPAWKVVEALRDMGAFRPAGLDIVSEIWGAVEFVGKRNHWDDARDLTEQMLTRLQAAGLFTEQTRQEQIGRLYNDWQMPMYRIDFKRIEVPLEELHAARDVALWGEMG